MNSLRRIGYWGGGANQKLPDPILEAGADWLEREKEEVEDYLARGFVSRAYLGYARCRVCGERIGCLELTDGTFVWPDGLLHYVAVHGVRLPREFIDHVLERVRSFMEAGVDDEWWIAAMCG